MAGSHITAYREVRIPDGVNIHGKLRVGESNQVRISNSLVSIEPSAAFAAEQREGGLEERNIRLKDSVTLTLDHIENHIVRFVSSTSIHITIVHMDFIEFDCERADGRT